MCLAVNFFLSFRSAYQSTLTALAGASPIFGLIRQQCGMFSLLSACVIYDRLARRGVLPPNSFWTWNYLFSRCNNWRQTFASHVVGSAYWTSFIGQLSRSLPWCLPCGSRCVGVECWDELRRRRFGSFQPLQAHFYEPWSMSWGFSANPGYCGGCPGVAALTFSPPASKCSYKGL